MVAAVCPELSVFALSSNSPIEPYRFLLKVLKQASQGSCFYIRHNAMESSKGGDIDNNQTTERLSQTHTMVQDFGRAL